MMGRALSRTSGKAKRIPILSVVMDLSSQNPCGGKCYPRQDSVDLISIAMVIKGMLRQQSLLLV